MKLRSLDPTAVAAPVAWIALPFLLGPLLAEALDPRSSAFRTTATIGLWAWWSVVLVALVVPRPVMLSLGRIGAAAALPAAVWAALATEVDGTAAIGLVAAAIAATVPLLPAVGERFVDGESYGDERRFLLRPPGPVQLALVTPTWAVVVAGVVTGPLLLAAEQWVAGVAATLVGLPAAAVGFAALHRLTRRFLVFVPNGLVVHDRSALTEPVLFARHEVAGFAPAAEGSPATDLTAQALGLALELRLGGPAQLPVVTGRTDAEQQTVRSILVTPTRPAAVLAHAADRGFPIA